MSRDVERWAAGSLLASFPGVQAPDWIRRWLERGLGGIVLFADNVRDGEQVAEMSGALRSAQPDLVVAIDEEGGDVTRLEAASGSSYPGNLALGSVDDVELTRSVAGAIAVELRAAGVTLNLAPVADVNSNPQNPVIGVRAFGSEPELVARHVAAFVTGTQERGIAACVKHFPGHGDTGVDSHLDLPVVDDDREELAAGPLLPFRAAVDTGVAAIMTAHILAPALDSVPATMSEPVVTGLLRGELGFDGVIVSDALEMKAISAHVGIEEGAVRAIAAGVDALCLGHDVDDDLVERVHGALLHAASSGRVTPERLENAADAVMGLGGLAAGASSDGPADPAIGAEAARRALRVRGDVALEGPPLVVELEPTPLVAAGPAVHGLGSEISMRRSASTVLSLHERPGNPAEVVRSAEGRPLVLVLRDAARHPWQQDTASDLIELRPDAVVVETGLPGWTPSGVTTYIETLGSGRVNVEAAADLLVPG